MAFVAPKQNNLTTVHATRLLKPPSAYDIKVTWTTGERYTAFRLATEVKLSWEFYENRLIGPRSVPEAPFEGFTVHGDSGIRTRFSNVVNLRGVRLTNEEARKVSQEVFDWCMQAWSWYRYSYEDVTWDVKKKGSGSLRVVAQGKIDTLRPFPFIERSVS